MSIETFIEDHLREDLESAQKEIMSLYVQLRDSREELARLQLELAKTKIETEQLKIKNRQLEILYG